jgi:CzcA family heavy metal efflux pump
MFKTIVAWATVNKFKTLFLSALISALGIIAGINMNVDVLPDINKPTVAVFAEADGFAPEEIEKLVLTPLENALLGTAGVERVRGVASFGLGIVNSEFSFDSDIYRNRQLIQERIASVVLPERVKVSLGPISSVLGEIVWVGVTGDENVNDLDLRTYADFTLRPNILKTKGISDVIVMGGDVLEWQIRLNADAMAKLGITQEMVNEVVKLNLVNTSGGLLTQQDKEYPVRVFVTPESIEELQSLALQTDQGVVRLGEIASFVKGASQVRGTAAIDGKHGVVLRVFKQPDAETLSVTKSIDTLVEEIQKTAPSGITLKTDLFRQEWFISSGLKNVEDALRDAFILVAIIVFIFLAKWRPTVITLIAIPVSMAITALIFFALGLSVNVMTLGGIAVAIGELVDDAIVSVENIIKRLRGKKLVGMERLHTIVDAVQEVRGSIIYATILVVLVFTPVFFLPGVEGKLLSSLGLAYIVSLVASLIVSLTLTPALASLLLKDEDEDEKAPRLIVWVERKTEHILNRLFAYWKQIGIAFLVTIFLTGVLYSFAGKEGIPPFNEDSLTISVVLPNGTSLETTSLYAQTVGDSIKSLPFISRVSHITGRAGADAHDSGSNTSEIQVVLNAGSAEKISEYIPQIQTILNKYDGAEYSVGKPITHRVEELLSGVRAPIVIKLYGNDIDELRKYGNSVVSVLGGIEGVTNPQLSRDIKIPEIHIYPEREALASRGSSAGVLGEELESGFLGNKVGEVVEGLQRIPVVTKLDNESRNSFTGLRDTTFSELGTSIGNISSIEIAEGRNKVSHEGGKRVVVVSANYEGKDVVGAVEEVKTTLIKAEHPENITVSYEGTYQSQKENSSRLAFMFSIIVLLIGWILYRAFGSWILTGLIMLNIPVAFFGGLVFVYLFGGTISLAHLVGFISLAGIVSRNGIMLISRAQELAKEKNTGFDKYVIVRATKERVVPVLMTSIVTALALVPLILNGSAPGKEFLHPLAIVMTGGLITSTLSSLFLMPVLLERFAKNRH